MIELPKWVAQKAIFVAPAGFKGMRGIGVDGFLISIGFWLGEEEEDGEEEKSLDEVWVLYCLPCQVPLKW